MFYGWQVLFLSLSLGKFVSVMNSFYENNSTITLCCERNNCVIDDKKRGCVKMYTSSFLCTKPRLSQARALLFPKVFVPLGIQKISLWQRYTFVLTYTRKWFFFLKESIRISQKMTLFVFLDALVDNLMLDNVYKLYKPSGRKPYHPQMMLKVILYAYYE